MNKNQTQTVASVTVVTSVALRLLRTLIVFVYVACVALDGTPA